MTLTRDEKYETPIDRFHKHIDKCEHCKNHLILCETGKALAEQAEIQRHNEIRRKEYIR